MVYTQSNHFMIRVVGLMFESPILLSLSHPMLELSFKGGALHLFILNVNLGGENIHKTIIPRTCDEINYRVGRK